MKQLTLIGSTTRPIEVHPLTKIIPDMTPREFKLLVESIRECGLITPIRTYREQIIDGRQRYRACLEAGVEPCYEEWAGEHDDSDIFRFIVSVNLRRQMLTKDQIAVIAVEALPFYDSESRAVVP